MAGWTHPICGTCWLAYDARRATEEGRDYLAAPTHLRDTERETCAICGAETTGGIYIRLNPKIAAELASARVV